MRKNRKNNQTKRTGGNGMNSLLILTFWIGVELLIMFYPEYILIPILIIAMCPWFWQILMGK